MRHLDCLSIACFIVSQFVGISLIAAKLIEVQPCSNLKDFKKLLKTNPSTLVLFSKNAKSAVSPVKLLEGVAKELKGRAMFAYVNCGENKEVKKLCKKYDASPNPTELKHFKDGNFNKDYDRKITHQSLVYFMLNPTGDSPWVEDQSANDVVHIRDEQDLARLRRREKGPLLIMFYAPWCGYCTKLKPEYAGAATELKGKAVLAGMDVDAPDAHKVRYEFNITAFPTLIYFEQGEQKYKYSGKMDKEGLVKWMQNPSPDAEKPEEPADDEWVTEAPEILHLTDQTFQDGLEEHNSLLVMFYAPWCGHCKKMKPEFVAAAKRMKEEEISGVLAAVDCIKQQKACSKFDVSGYPTVKYFNNGTMKFAINVGTQNEIVAFMRDPAEPLTPLPQDLPWAETSGPTVLHLTDSNFRDELKKRKHVLVMFYAPWCGHCKIAKPEFESAAASFGEDRKVFFAAVDCIAEKKSCEAYEVQGFPTFRYFQYGRKASPYNGGRTANDFIAFMNYPTADFAPLPAPPKETEWKDVPSSIVHLTDADFAGFIANNPSVLVMFYAPWCGHCKAMKSVYAEAAAKLAEKKPGALLAAVDCTKERETAQKYGISGYPTLKYFKNGEELMEYDRQRTTEEFVDFMTNVPSGEAKPRPTEAAWEIEAKDVAFLTEATFTSYVEKHQFVLAMFYAPWCGHCQSLKPTYQALAKKTNAEKENSIRLAAVDCPKNPELCHRNEVEGYPTLRFYKDGTYLKNYEGSRTEADLIQFLRQNTGQALGTRLKAEWPGTDSPVKLLTSEVYDAFLQENDCLVMFFAPWCGHCSSLKPDITTAAETLAKEGYPAKIAAVDCSISKDLASKENIQGYPTLKYYSKGEFVGEYEGDRSAGDLVSFVRAQRESSPDRRPAPIDRERFQDLPSAVFHLNSRIFAPVMSEMPNALVLFHSPHCEGILNIRSQFMKAASRVSERKDVRFAAVDCSDEPGICSGVGVTLHPTIRHYRNGQMLGGFPLENTADNFVKYLLDNSRKKEEL